MKIFISVLLLACLYRPELSGYTDERFVTPEKPMEVSNAISNIVENGATYESGSIQIPENMRLILPESAVVEEHLGSAVRFYLTKSMSCAGHPPHPMEVERWRNYLGIASQISQNDCVVSTFGEWSNRGGSANLRLLVLVPKAQKVERTSGLDGQNSRASKDIDFNDPAMQKCYWYSGIKPKDGWEPISTELNYNRFLEKR